MPGCLTTNDAASLRESYRLFRRILFVLRRQENRSVSSIPDSPSAQEKLARRLNFESLDAFWTAYTKAREQAADAASQLLS
jgi:glutamine synthetase adenylyltransferase